MEKFGDSVFSSFFKAQATGENYMNHRDGQVSGPSTQHLPVALGTCHGNELDPHRSDSRLAHGQMRQRSYLACRMRPRVRVPGACIQEERPTRPAGVSHRVLVPLLFSLLPAQPESFTEGRGNQQMETSQSWDCRGLRSRGDRSDPRRAKTKR